MKYVIDANNLAGKLGLLEEYEFDKKLLEVLKKYFKGKQIDIYLIYDSADIMGDKEIEGNFKIIYTPRDSYYDGADDKIIEIIKNYISKAMVLVTDDIDLMMKVEKVEENAGIKINKIKATDFAEKIVDKIEENKKKSELSDAEKNEINDELLKLWT